jgi:hypothetical protein
LDEIQGLSHTWRALFVGLEGGLFRWDDRECRGFPQGMRVPGPPEGFYIIFGISLDVKLGNLVN